MTADRIAAALASRRPKDLDLGLQDCRRAAVLIPIQQRLDGDRLVLTKRAEQLNHHRGQVAFPGGSVDLADASELDAALRECYEEIGVRPEDVRVLGRLDQVTAGYNFIVTPFVGLIPPDVSFRLDPAETEAVFTVPVAALLDPGCVQLAERLSSHGDPIYHFYYEGWDIWGATARMIVQLLDVVYEQRPWFGQRSRRA